MPTFRQKGMGFSIESTTLIRPPNRACPYIYIYIQILRIRTVKLKEPRCTHSNYLYLGMKIWSMDSTWLPKNQELDTSKDTKLDQLFVERFTPCQLTSQLTNTPSKRWPPGSNALAWKVDPSKTTLLMEICSVIWHQKISLEIWVFLVWKVSRKLKNDAQGFSLFAL